MLRQGRGNGFREALRAGRSAAADILSCVVNDPRWDRQVEERERYYGSLLVRLDIDIAPIAERVIRAYTIQDESAFWLPVGVLAQMARRAHEPAKAALAEAIRRGRRWRTCLDALEAAGGEPLIRDVVRSRELQGLIKSVDADALAAAVRMVAAPWREWATELPALRFVLAAETGPERERKPMSGPVHWAAPRIRQPAGPAVSSRLTADELLELVSAAGPSRQIEKLLLTRSDEATLQALRRVATAGTPEQQTIALRVLGERGCPEFIEAAERFLRDESRQPSAERKEHQTRQAYLRYLERLPAHVTLERGRQWFTEPWPLSLAGEHILAQHATRDDRAILEEAGSAALTASDMYRLCSVIDGLAAVGDVESLPFLHEAYSTAPYSYARRRVVRALVPHVGTDNVASDLVEEALWDCEPEARELACGAVSREMFPAAGRLAELADDQFEEPAVRAAARRASGSRRS